MQENKDDIRIERLKRIVAAMPEKPGSYQYYDREGTIIYVGKAKNLKARVSSYFHTEVDRFKTKVLVSKIEDISYTVVNTEEDALLLENQLIKKYTPRYNVLLKDGKTYPSICITNEPLPRIFVTRRIDRKAGTYYGPYSHAASMHAVLQLIRETFRPRTCRTPITPESIAEGRHHVCLDYHIHRCLAPCCGKQSVGEYREAIAEAREILKGNTRGLMGQMMDEMTRLASELKFEEAEELKRKYLLVGQFAAKSEVVSHVIDNVDVVTVDSNDTEAYINFMHVAGGAVCQSFTFEYRKRLDETDSELLALGIVEMRERFKSGSKEVVVPFEVDCPLEGVTLTVPQRSDRKKLLELSLMNCRQYRADRLKQAEKLNPEQRQTRLMGELQKLLRLPTLPMTIEAFDNSNISGSDAVAGCVVFKALKPSKADYRKYNIKTVVGPDDYASMREVVLRRYGRMKAEGQALPDLIITDGGRGQMEVVRRAVEDELGLSIPIAGLAKDDRHRTRELLCGFPPVVVGMKPDGELFRLMTRIQDEVHRFAITFHRDKRSAHALHSELDGIRGVGPAGKTALLAAFKTVRAIKAATEEQLVAAVGKAKARAVYAHFHKGE